MSLEAGPATTEPAGAAEPAAPRVAVVLLNYHAGAEADTLACVRSLRESDYPALHVILVDNGSPPEVGDRLERCLPDVTLLRTGRNMGFTGGNNRGIERALADGFDYVLVLNNDTVVERDCVRRLVETAEREARVGVVGGKILFYDDPDRIWFAGGRLSAIRALGIHRGEGEPDAGRDDVDPEEVTFLTGCCMLVPAGVLREIGGFDEDFFAYVEDVDFSHRVRTAGYRLVYAPSARLYHRIPLEEPAIPPHKIVLRDRNRRRLVRRRFPLPQRLLFSLFFYPTRAVHAARYLLKGDRARLVAVWRGMTAP